MLQFLSIRNRDDTGRRLDSLQVKELIAMSINYERVADIKKRLPGQPELMIKSILPTIFTFTSTHRSLSRLSTTSELHSTAATCSILYSLKNLHLHLSLIHASYPHTSDYGHCSGAASSSSLHFRHTALPQRLHCQAPTTSMQRLKMVQDHAVKHISLHECLRLMPPK